MLSWWWTLNTDISHCWRGLRFPCTWCDFCWSTTPGEDNNGVECFPFAHNLPDSWLLESKLQILYWFWYWKHLFLFIQCSSEQCMVHCCVNDSIFLLYICAKNLALQLLLEKHVQFNCSRMTTNKMSAPKLTWLKFGFALLECEIHQTPCAHCYFC